MSEIVQQITELLRTQNTFLVLTHYRPDGDAVGSQLALVLMLKGLGKTVEAWNDDEVPKKFRFLPSSELITRPPAEPKDFDVVIAIDTSTWQRVGSAAQRIGKRKHFINIDHHVSNPRYGDVNWIEPHAAAAGEIVHKLIKHGGFALTKDIADCLFTAVSTDTLSFSLPTATDHTFEVAAELVRAGADVGKITRHIYESYPYARFQLLQAVLGGTKLTHKGHVSYCWITNEMYTKTAARREDTEGLIDFIRGIDGVYVAFVFEDMPEADRVRISLRSKHKRVDVNSIARHFGGGGHREAAGARITGAPREVESAVLDVVDKALTQADL